MAVITKNEKAKIQLCDVHGKTLCTYSGIFPGIYPETVSLFAESINTLRKDTVSYIYLISEAELENTEEEE